METKLNYYLPLALFVLLCGAITWAVVERNKKVEAQQQANTAAVLSKPDAKVDAKFVDKLQQQHVTFNTTANQIGGKIVAVSKPLLDSIAGLSNVKASDITDWKQINASTEARALKAEKQVDSLKKTIYFIYKDKYVNIAYHPADSTDTTGTFDFKYDASLTATSYIKRTKFLGLPIGPVNSYTDIYSNDPRTTINGLKTFSVKEQQPFFGLRIQAGGSYSFRQKTYLFGPAAQLYLDRFSVTGTYYYSPIDNRFSPSIGARYDIFR